MTSVTQILLLDGTIAIASHYLWFKPYEPTSYSSIAFVALLLVSPIIRLLQPLVYSLTRAIALAVTTYVLALLGSVAVYRLSPFHPLAAYPGPLVCKVTNLWTAYIASTGKSHRYYEKLHDKYGKVVRIGPNQISVTDKELFPLILGAQGMPKGPVWEARRLVTSRKAKGHRSLHAVRDLKLHAELRKPWNKAFGRDPLKDYESVVLETSTILLEQLQGLYYATSEAKQGIVVDAAKWLSSYSFDFMGNMVFGKSFNLLTAGDPENVWDTMQRSTIFPSVAQHIPWVADFTRLFPVFTRHTSAFAHFAATQAKWRAANDPSNHDLFFHLLKNTEVEPGASPLPLIMADAVLGIVAGSDTTAAALSNMLYYFARYPVWQDRIRSEVDELCEKVPDLAKRAVPEPDALADLKNLNAFINETLRLLPPLPTMLQRAPAAGSGGRQLGDWFLPEGNSVQIPPFAVHREPGYFSPMSKEFLPQRWFPDADSGPASLTLEGDIVLERSAFIPFSMGPANCVGKSVALKQLRYVPALLLRNFRFEFPEGYNPDRWEEELQDRFLMAKGELPLRMVLRE